MKRIEILWAIKEKNQVNTDIEKGNIMGKIIFSILILGFIALLFFSGIQETDTRYDASRTPLIFAQNNGQYGSQTQYIAKNHAATILFAQNEIAFIFDPGKTNPAKRQSHTKSQTPRKDGEDTIHGSEQNPILKRHFSGANLRAKIIGEEASESPDMGEQSNRPFDQSPDTPHFSRIRFVDLYDHIDVVCSGYQSILKTRFTINPQGDPEKIKLKYDRADAIYYNVNGDLVIKSSLGCVIERKPFAFQMIKGEKKPLDVSYLVSDDYQSFEISVNRYDTSVPLHILLELDCSIRHSEMNLETAVD